jgi:hypothetical protein
MTNDARVRGNVGRCAASPLRQSRTQPHRQHRSTITTGHVLALVRESSALDRLRPNRSRRLALPCCSDHEADTVSTESPTPQLILEALGTTKQEEVRRGAETDCGDPSTGKGGRHGVDRQRGDGDTSCEVYEQRPPRCIDHASSRGRYVTWHATCCSCTDRCRCVFINLLRPPPSALPQTRCVAAIIQHGGL